MTRSSWRERRARVREAVGRLRGDRRGRRGRASGEDATRDRRAPGRLSGRRRAKLRGPLIGLAALGVGFPLAAGRPLADAPHKVRLETSASAKRAIQARRAIIDRAMHRFGIARDLAEDIHDVAVAEGVDPSIGFGLVRTESSFRERVVSYAGAHGLTQVLPTTARWVLDGPTEGDALFERRTNLRAGFRYLRYLQERYDGDLRLALIAYNRGPGTVERVLVQGVDPDNGYPDRVLRHGI